MAKNIPTTPPADDDALIKRVDAMMDPAAKPAPAAVPPKQAEVPSEPTSATPKPAIDIFKDTKTAPEVSAKLLKNLSVSTRPTALPIEDKPIAEAPESKPELPTDAAPAVSTASVIDSKRTDKAVDEIIASEGDELLAAQDASAAAQLAPKKPIKKSWKQKFRNLRNKKLILIVLFLLLVIIAAVPYTRYAIVGLVVKKPVSIIVLDSKTSTPVSNATVVLHGVSAKTDAEGHATVKVAPGNATLTITKQYYTSYSVKYSIGLGSQPNRSVDLVATGRQVPVTVLNSITGKPLSGVTIKILDTTAKTNKKGLATIVLPTATATKPATLQLAGYNTAKVTTTITDKVVAANSFKITPTGHIYFLSNSNGTIDVVRSNLDGSERKTILEGTGKEDARTTSLLASRDWRYVVLKAKRDSAQPSLYLIDTATDKATPFESGDNEITLVGWYNHNFIYDVVKNATPQQQAGREVVKSYDAEHSQPNQLDQSQAEGTAKAYAYQSFANFYILNGVVSYTTGWYDDGTGFDLSGKQATIRTVQPNGQSKKDYQSFDATETSYIDAALYEPQGVYYGVYNSKNYKTTYYHFENQAITADTTLTADNFGKAYPTYLLSPAGSETFWSELRDGKNTLFTGDANADKKQQIATLSDYSPYGWYGSSYVLVSKSSSELYILPASGLSAGQTPLKVTDYYKPTQTYAGYGYGYGGL